MARSRGKPLRFHGESRALSIPLPEAWADVDAAPSLKLDAPHAEQAQVGLVWLRSGGGLGLRIRLPPATPPGTYKGEIAVGKDKRAVVVAVPPETRLRITPVEPEVTVAPGEAAQTTLSAFNQGNVPLELPERPAVTFYGPCEQPTAHEVKIPGLDRFVAFTAELTHADGPVAEIELLDGAGTLAAGDSRALTLGVRADAALAPGARYVGEWRLPSDNVAIGLTVGGSTDQELT